MNFTTPRVAVRLSNTNLTEHAVDLVACDDAEETHKATISPAAFAALQAAQAVLDANPTFNAIHLSSDLECPTLDAALDAAAEWRTGTEELLLFRHGGLYLRITNRFNDAASITGPHHAHIDIIARMAASMSAFETSRGPEPWQGHASHPLDWDVVCKAFANDVAAYLVQHGERPDFDAVLKHVTDTPNQ